MLALNRSFLASFRATSPRPVPGPARPEEPRLEPFPSFRMLAPERCTPEAAADPGTPVEVLAALLELYPRTVLRNPAWELSLVTDPTMLRRLTMQQAVVAARCPALDAGSVMALVRRSSGVGLPRPNGEDRRIAFALVCRADIGRAALEELIRPWNRATAGTMAQEIALRRLEDPELLGGWREAVPALLARDDGSTMADIVRTGQCWRFIGDLVRSGDLPVRSPIVRAAVAMGREDLRWNVVAALPESSDRDELLTLAAYSSVCRRFKIPPRTLQARATVRCWNSGSALGPEPARLGTVIVGRWIRNDPFLPACAQAIAEQTARWARRDPWPMDSWHERERRKATLPGRCAIAARRPRRDLRLDALCLVASDRCPRPLLRRASEDAHWLVRLCAASNRGRTPAVARRLAEDDHWAVRAAARGDLGSPPRSSGPALNAPADAPPPALTAPTPRTHPPGSGRS